MRRIGLRHLAPKASVLPVYDTPYLLFVFAFLVMYDAVAVRTNNHTLSNLFRETAKSNLSSKATYTKQFIFTFFMMKIKDTRIFDATPTTSQFFFVFAEPLIMLIYEG